MSNEILKVEIQANILKQARGDMNLNVCQWQLDAVSNPIYFRKCVTVAGVRNRHGDDGRLTRGGYGYLLIPSGSSGKERVGRHLPGEERKEV